MPKWLGEDDEGYIVTKGGGDDDSSGNKDWQRGQHAAAECGVRKAHTVCPNEPEATSGLLLLLSGRRRWFRRARLAVL